MHSAVNQFGEGTHEEDVVPEGSFRASKQIAISTQKLLRSMRVDEERLKEQRGEPVLVNYCAVVIL